MKIWRQAFRFFLILLWCDVCFVVCNTYLAQPYFYPCFIQRCIYPLICNRIFEVFSCEKFDNGERLLRADYSIDCDLEKHKSFQALAGIMIAVYPIGVLVLFYCALAPHAAELSDVVARESKSAKSRHLAFFSMDYKGKYW
jgi:hypothetical protein